MSASLRQPEHQFLPPAKPVNGISLSVTGGLAFPVRMRALLHIFIHALLFPVRLPLFLYYRLTLLRKRPVLHLRFPDRFSLFESSGWLERFVGATEDMNYFRFLLMLRRVRLSRELKTLIIELPPGLDEALDWSQAFEIADELSRIRETGKRIIAHATGGGLRTLLLVSRADVRLAAQGAHFLTALPHAEPFFYADLLGDLGLRVEVYHAGRFKSAGENLSRTGISAAAKENLTTILRGLRTLFLARLEATPGLDIQASRRLKRLLDEQSITTPEDLLRCGFFNNLIESAHLLRYAKDGSAPQLPVEHVFAGPGDRTLRDAPLPTETKSDADAIDPITFLRREGRRNFRPITFRRKPAIALAVMHGLIVQGKDGDPARSGNIVATAWREILRELEEGDEKAIILYIDSPGGTSDASESIYQDLRRLSRKKPVFAMLGGVAASGGYYIACGANRIHASPVSLTGSIGVVRIRPQAAGLLKKWRVHSERILFDDTTDILSLTDRVGRKSRKLLEENTAATYLEFLRRVGEGRGMGVADVQKKAEGRVFLGCELQRSGLIDGLTGLLPLLEHFRHEAGYGEDRLIEVRLLPTLRFDLRRTLRAGLPFSPGRTSASLLDGLMARFPAAALLPAIREGRSLCLMPFRSPLSGRRE